MNAFALPKTIARSKIKILMTLMTLVIPMLFHAAKLWYGQVLVEEQRLSLWENKQMMVIRFTKM